MGTTPNNPAPAETEPYETSSVPRWVILAFVAAFALVGYLLYANHETRQEVKTGLENSSKKADLLAAQLDKANASLADLKSELELTTQKLGLTQDELARARSLAQTVRKEQKTSDQQLRARIGEVQQETSSKIGEVSTELSGTKGEVETTKRDLESTKGQLQRTIGDLGVQSGLIARNHEEVEELKRLGERNIYEFDLPKTKAPQRVGPIMVQLRKTDQKHYRYTMTVIADDKSIEKKDKTVGEPVQFYIHGVRVPYEIVVFTVMKDHASGYLSTSKDAPPAASANH
jgi:uncharacterized protein (DUF3084 family)